jgi:hypothetical protein
VLHIDDSRAGKHRQALHVAATRFWRMYPGESFFVWSEGKGPKGFQVSIRKFGDERASQLVVQIIDYPEGAILCGAGALVGGSQHPLKGVPVPFHPLFLKFRGHTCAV